MESQLNELTIKRFKNKRGCYLILAYTEPDKAVLKIGMSDELLSRLQSYQGVYYNHQYLQVWESKNPIYMEKCLHMFAMQQLKLVRKNKYELFTLQDVTQIDSIVQALDRHYQDTETQIESAYAQGLFDETEELQAIQTQIDNLNNIEQNSNSEQISCSNTQTSGNDSKRTRISCEWPSCIAKTTHASKMCSRHRSDVRQKNSEFNKKISQLRKLQANEWTELLKIYESSDYPNKPVFVSQAKELAKQFKKYDDLDVDSS